MPEYDNNNRGVLFKNTDKKTDKHPDYTGTATIEKEDTAPSQNTQTDSQDIPF
jgi:hypothetical protein